LTNRPELTRPDGALLRTENLVKAFGGVTAVDHLNFELPAGELRCLIGPNGAGKSTLFGLLSGLHRPDSGIILFKGEDITRLPPYQRVRRGLCQKFQTTRIYRDLTVAQNLLIAGGARSRGETNERLEWALRTLRLSDELDLRAGRLPHSHQQWLEICLTLATEPDLVLLDEPTAGMTPDETAVTARFLIDLNEHGLTVLVVEHDMAFVRLIAHRVTVLHYGRIFSYGTLEEIEANQEVRRIYLGEQ
jgi:branched-chain amino acid transport system ATP-binding protein